MAGHDVPQQTRSIDKLKDEFSRLETSFDSLKTDITIEKTTIERTRDETVNQIDEQVTRIHDEVTEIGENMKEKVRKINFQDPENTSSGTSVSHSLTRLLEKTNSALEEVRDAMSDLEKSSRVWNEERLDEVQQKEDRLDQSRQEVEDSMTTVISDVKVVKFVAEEISRNKLSNQVGRVSIVGEERERMFEVLFSIDRIRNNGKDTREIEYGGLKWSVKASREVKNDIVSITLSLNKTSNRSGMVNFKLKLVNINDDEDSLMKDGEQIFKSGSFYFYWKDCISWSKLSNTEDGFITENNKIKIKVTLKILENYI